VLEGADDVDQALLDDIGDAIDLLVELPIELRDGPSNQARPRALVQEMRVRSRDEQSSPKALVCEIDYCRG